MLFSFPDREIFIMFSPWTTNVLDTGYLAFGVDILVNPRTTDR